MMRFSLNLQGNNKTFLTIALTTGILVAAGCGTPKPVVEEAPQKASAVKVDAELLPRKILLGNPDKASARISPDGTRLSYLAPRDGVLNVWVGPVDDPSKAKPITADKKRGVRTYFWAYTSKHIVYLQDKEGDENWHVHVVDLEKGETRNLTPFKGVKAEINAVSHLHPEEILIGLNKRDPKLHDLYRLNLETGESTVIQENPGFVAFLIDDDYNIRFGMRITPDGGSALLKPRKESEEKADTKARKIKKGKDADKEEKTTPANPFADWEPFMKIGMEDSLTTGPIDFDKTGKVLYMLDSRDRNTAAYVVLDLETGQKQVVAEDPRADLQDLMIHPTEKTVEAVAFTYERKEWKILDSSIQGDFEALSKVTDGDFEVISRTLDDTQWIVAYIVDNGPVRYYHFNRSDKKARFLFTNRSDLEDKTLVKIHPVVIQSRDGLNLVSYYSLPPGSDSDGDGRPDQPLPTVLNVHGGPWTRVEWGYNPRHQWFTNRGYAILNVNFRGSTGFGKEFINASNMEWAGKMHDDLIDAVEWAVNEGIADRERVAIFGGSYGGYATLVGLTFTPEVFACGVDIVGPSNLMTLLLTIPPYWAPMIDQFTRRIGDHRTEEGRVFLNERSPLNRVNKIQRPLLIAQGANDPRVKQSESDQIVDAMKAKGIPVTYVLYPDEGHGFARPENRLSFYAVTEAFLSECLGGRFEEIGEDFKGSSISVPNGSNHVPGLDEALNATGN
ncbi:MAG: S9 family peptidase [Proteobacteria bacterium]|nr:S9 family peptidase [Pseudomonadota bacterium]